MYCYYEHNAAQYQNNTVILSETSHKEYPSTIGRHYNKYYVYVIFPLMRGDNNAVLVVRSKCPFIYNWKSDFLLF